MKIKKGLVFLLVVLAAIGGVLAVSLKKDGSEVRGGTQAVYYCPMHPTYTSDKQGDCPICNMKLVKRVAADSSADKINSQKAPAKKSLYYCPMHPTYTSDKQGDCPICNMKLVKRDAAETSAVDMKAMKAEDICYMHNCSSMKPGEKCQMMVVAKSGETVSCPMCGVFVAQNEPGMLLAKKILYWTDPMVPGFKADKPGVSARGAELIAVYEESANVSNTAAAAPEGYAPILVTAQKRQLIGVRTEKVMKRKISKTIRTVGRIAYDPELYQAQQEYISSLRASNEAEKNSNTGAAESAGRLVESSRMRLKLLGLSEELIDEVSSWDSPDKSLLLAGPSGKAWLYAPVYEYELALVKVGQTVSVEIPSGDGKVLTGMIGSIDSILDPMTRTARVRAVLVDPDKGLKPEMFVNVSIAVDAKQVLAMPEEAVFNTGSKQIVFVDKGNGIFEPRDVKVGFKTDGFYELKEGVLDGESVVTSGNFLIDSESRLKAALDGMAEERGHQHGQ